MPHFNYTAVDSQGKTHTGSVSANTEAEAAGLIKEKGLFPTSIAEATKEQTVGKTKGEGFLGFGKKKRGSGKVSGKTLMVFTRQLATLIDAGMPLLRSLRVLIKQETNVNLRNAMMSLAEAVESGSPFSEALAQHPRIFTKLYVNMVRAGELGGVLEIVLNRLAEFQEKSQRLKGRVISAMVYPIVVLLIAIGILTFLMIVIVPQFETIFATMLGEAELPTLTAFVVGISRFMMNNILLIIGAIVVLVVGFNVFKATAFGAETIDRLKLKMPIFGDLMNKTAIARFTRTLGTLVSSGVPILNALNITRETSGNLIIAAAIGQVHERVKEGDSMVAPLEAAKFPPIVVSMIQVGEETGNLPDMLNKVADVYEEEVDVTVAGLTSLLEPIMIVVLALIVGVIVTALFLPLLGIISNLSAGAR